MSTWAKVKATAVGARWTAPAVFWLLVAMACEALEDQAPRWAEAADRRARVFEERADAVLTGNSAG